jgi:molybdenum cofactor synthesis domain-containing protein
MSDVSIIIIGDEILSNTFVDENTPWLLHRAKKLDLRVNTVRIISDTLEDIIKTVREESDRSTYVITTGGVGPTHDDVTMEAIATAFGTSTYRNPRLAKLIADKMGADNEGALLMANIPQGAELLESAKGFFPQVKVQNVYIFPGVPKLMKIKFDAIAHHFVGKKLFKKKIYLQAKESKLAPEITTLNKKLDKVTIGSYPRFDEGPVNLILTVQGFLEDDVLDAYGHISRAFQPYLHSTQEDT